MRIWLLPATAISTFLSVTLAIAFAVTPELDRSTHPVPSEPEPTVLPHGQPLPPVPSEGEPPDERVPQLHHASVEAHLTLGVELYAGGEYAAAIAEFETVLREVPDQAEARYYLEQARVRQRQAELAPGTVGTDDLEAPAIARAFLQRGTRCLIGGDPSCAAGWLREAIRLDPSLVDAHLRLGLALSLMGDTDGALDAYRAALQRQPTRALLRVQLATALMAKEDWATAARELDEAIRLQPDLWQAHIALGEVRYARGDIPGAMASFRQALTLNPSVPDAHARLGLLLKLQGRDQEAVGELRAAAEGGVPTAQYFVARAYASGDGTTRDPAEAVRWYLRAAEQGHADARDALVQWRAAALGSRPSTVDPQTAREAFAGYRRLLRRELLGDDGSETDEPVGSTLLAQGRTDQAVRVLIREASALGEQALLRLERLYEEGRPDTLPPFDSRILRYFQAAAAEGEPGPRRALARIYARGLGVPRDTKKAAALLKGDSHEAARQLLQELAETAP